MWKKLIVIALAVSAVGFASAPRSNAGTEMIEPYNAPAPRYNYVPPPPPRPVLYVPPPVVGFVVAPGFGYYPRPFRAYGYHRAYGRPFYRHGRHWR